MKNPDMNKSEHNPDSEGQEMEPAVNREAVSEEVVDSIEGELTDEQLLQMAEGSCSWGANCNKDC
jgi:hypothetical protein